MVLLTVAFCSRFFYNMTGFVLNDRQYCAFIFANCRCCKLFSLCMMFVFRLLIRILPCQDEVCVFAPFLKERNGQVLNVVGLNLVHYQKLTICFRYWSHNISLINTSYRMSDISLICTISSLSMFMQFLHFSIVRFLVSGPLPKRFVTLYCITFYREQLKKPLPSQSCSTTYTMHVAKNIEMFVHLFNWSHRLTLPTPFSSVVSLLIVFLF